MFYIVVYIKRVISKCFVHVQLLAKSSRLASRIAESAAPFAEEWQGVLDHVKFCKSISVEAHIPLGRPRRLDGVETQLRRS